MSSVWIHFSECMGREFSFCSSHILFKSGMKLKTKKLLALKYYFIQGLVSHNRV